MKDKTIKTRKARLVESYRKKGFVPVQTWVSGDHADQFRRLAKLSREHPETRLSALAEIEDIPF